MTKNTDISDSHFITDTEVLDWLDKNPNILHWSDNRKCWRRVFGWKDHRNQFKSLRQAVKAHIIDPDCSTK